MGDGRPFTRSNLTLALRVKVHAAGRVLMLRGIEASAEEAADAIKRYDLDCVIAGRHDGRPVTFAKGYELVFGERLTLKRGAA